MPVSEAPLEAFRSVNFDWTRQLKSVWTDPHYHVSNINQSATDDIMDYFLSRTQVEGDNEPLGKVLVGPAGFGKTHLIGELRRRVWRANGWFVLLDFVGVKDFWSSVALGFLSSLQVRTPGRQTQYDLLISRLADYLGIKSDLAAATKWYQKDARELVTEIVKLFLSALSRVDRSATLKHRDVVTALVLMISEDLDYHSVAHAWLQGMDVDQEEARPLGLREENSPIKVVEGLSWLMSLVGPTLIAVDQIDAIVSASNAQARARAAQQTNEEELEAKAIVELLAEGLMEIHEKKRRAVTVVSCLEATWKIIEGGATASIRDRYLSGLPLKTLQTRETAEALIAARLAPAYEQYGFTPPYPTWPFTGKSLDAAVDYTPRQLLKRCEDFRRKCVAEGRVTECLSLEDKAASAETAPPRADIEAAFEREVAVANVAPLFTPAGEDDLRALLDSTLQFLVKHYDLPDAIDAEAQRDPDQKRPSLHGRVSFTFHDEGDREQHYCFRIIEHVNAIAFQSRLKAAMTASGIDTALKFRHLYVLRTSPLPTGKKTETLLDQFRKAGGKIIVPAEKDLRIFAALRSLAKEDNIEFEAWLRSKKPLFETDFFKSVELAPPPFLSDGGNPSGDDRPSGGGPAGGPGSGGVGPASNGAGNGSSPGNAAARDNTRAGSHKSGDHARSDASQHERKNAPRLIPLGRRFERGQLGDPVSLDAALLPRHVAIIAGSGSGKTVLLRRIVEEAALLGIPAIVLDINNDLSRLGDRWPETPADMSAEDAGRAERYHENTDVVIWTPGASSGRPMSLPLLPDFSRIGEGREAQDEREQAIAMALATLTPYIGGSGQRATLRQGVLAAALRFFAKDGTDSLEDFIRLLSELPDGVSQIKDSYKLASDMADQLRAAVDTNPLLRSAGVKLDPAQLFFGAKGRTRISVINFSGLASEAAKQAFVNQLQMALFTWIKANPSETGLLYVMDEAQNFVPSQVGTPCKESAKSLAAQARKYGLGMILATQLPKGIDNGIVSNCTTHVYGRMSSPTAIEAIKDLVRAKGGEADDVGRLKLGEFYFSTEGSARPFKIQTPLCLSWHAKNPPTAGEVMEKARAVSI
ncbi:ATP-binding protein [Rhodomicrobium sp.]|uniref:ATP-binding protein n=1 Tax=Rhodomicrobium sp. TaxID=2720632 RepID=UPI0039E2886F